MNAKNLAALFRSRSDAKKDLTRRAAETTDHKERQKLLDRAESWALRFPCFYVQLGGEVVGGDCLRVSRVSKTRPDGKPSKNAGKIQVHIGHLTPQGRMSQKTGMRLLGYLSVQPGQTLSPDSPVVMEWDPAGTVPEGLDLSGLLGLLCEFPEEVFALHRPAVSRCCFCGRRLTDPPSVWAGYGPCCAESHGLPHGKVGPLPTEFSSVEDSLALIRGLGTPAPAKTEAPESPEEEHLWLQPTLL